MTAVRIKTAELAGAMLDYWVALSEGRKNVVYHGFGLSTLENGTLYCLSFSPSKDWRDAGPIIEREHIRLAEGDFGVAKWKAHLFTRGCCFTKQGNTALVAAMRAYVASKFGDEVEAIEGGRG